MSFTLKKRMSLVRKIYIDSRTCSGNLADFTATLPEPIRADPTLGVILSQLTFVNNVETVMRDYTKPRLDGGRHDYDARLPCDHTDPGRNH